MHLLLRYGTVLLAVSVLAGVTAAGTTSAASERVLVTDVVDGDTIKVLRADGEVMIRLIGVDTPETGRPDTPVQFFGAEATDFTHRSLLKKRVRLEFESPDRPGGAEDRYARTLAYVFTDEGVHFNLELVRRGYGRAFMRYPFRYQREFVKAEQAARAAGIGIWNAERRAAWADPARRGDVIGNLRTGIYHVPGQKHYQDIKEKNRIYFRTEAEAQAAGYRRAKQ